MKRRTNRLILILAALWLACAVFPLGLAEDMTVENPVDIGVSADSALPAEGDPDAPEDDITLEIDPSDLPDLDDAAVELELDVPLLEGESMSLEGSPKAQGSPELVSNDDSDFTIEDGVLTKYTGAGGEVTIPATVTSIGEGAFYDCDSVTKVNIPTSVTSIGNEAFYNCDSITNVTIPASVTSIGNEAFYDCDAITDVTVPGSVNIIGDGAFRSCDGLTSVTLGAGVEEIGQSAFEYCEKLTTLTMGDGLKTVKEYAFLFSPIEELLFPDTVTSLSVDAIQAFTMDALTYALKKVHWPAGVKEIPEKQFWVFPALEVVEIPEGVTNIADYAFKKCPVLDHIDFPTTVTSIGDEAFYDCDAIANVTVPGSVNIIGESAFESCDGLTSVTLEAGVEEIGARAFEYCDNLSTLTMGDGLKTVREWAFAGSPIVELLFPDTVTTLSVNAIGGGTLPQTLRNVHWPAGVTQVNDYQFSGYSALEKVEIANGVNAIGDGAFNNCAELRTVIVPSTVVDIASNSFDDCPNLTIQTPSGSYAESYAENRNIPVTPTDENGKPIEPGEVRLNKTKATLVAGGKLKLKATVTPKNTGTKLTWSSSNKKVATVTNKGVVKALRKGSAIITVTTANGKKATCKITVPVAPTKVAFERDGYSMRPGKTLRLKPKLTPSKAKTTFTWSSSNKKVATVTSKGVVKSLKKGTATITVKTANGKKARVKIIVE